MDHYDIRRSTYNPQGNSIDKPKMYQSPSAARIAGANVISSSSDYKRISDDLDREFATMKAQTEEKRNTIIGGDELDRFSNSNEYSVVGKNVNDRLAERLFNEVYYRQENDDRARAEIYNMKQRISNIEKHLATAKEIQLKRELGDLLVERETLAELEKELYQDIVSFKEGYEKRKRSKFQKDNEDESQKLRELRRRKEQVDVERARMKNNLEKAERGDWRGIERDTTKLLKEAQAKRAKSFLFNPNPYDLESMKEKISKGTERVQELRRDREELLKYGAMNKYSNVKMNEEDLSEKMKKYLEEIERSKMSAIEKADKMRKFREKMSRLLNEDGIIDAANHQKAVDLLEELHQKHRLHPKSYENSMRISPRPDVSVAHHHSSLAVPPPGEDPMNSGLRDLGGQSSRPAKLTDEGLLLTKYQTQEKELRRALGFLSTESDLYRQTLLQILEVTQIISELEKVVEEQRLQMEWEREKQEPGGSDYARLKKEAAARLRKNVFGEENYGNNLYNNEGDLNEEEMKKEITARLRRNAFGDVEPKGYDRNVGFNVVFELISGLPRKYAFCQVVYAVYRKGEMIATPKLVEPHKCKLGHGFSSDCAFNEAYTVFDVSQSMDAMMIFEFQCLFESGIQSHGKAEAAGWTMIDLFDMMKTLKKGKWKLPVYFKPTNVNITMDRIKKLKRVREVWFYLRIGLPTDEEIPAAEKKSAEELSEEYEIPQMHKRYWADTAPPPDDHQEEKENLKFDVDIKAILQTGKNPKEEKKKGAEQKDIFQELFEEEKGRVEPKEDYDRFKPRKEHKPKMEPSPFNLMEELAKAEQQEQPQNHPQNQPVATFKKNLLDLSIDLEYYKGLKLTIVGLRNFAINSKFKITGGLIVDNEFILDENARDCVFATKPRELNDLFAYKKPRVGGSNTLGLNSSGEDSEELEETMAFNEDFYFLRDLPGLVVMKQNELDLLLVLQVVGIDYEAAKPKRKKKKTNTLLNDDDEEIKQGDDEGEGDLAAARKNIEDSYEFISWHVIKLNLSNGKLTRGRFIESLYEPPMKKPPFDSKQVAKTGAKIEFVIEEYSYDAAMLRKHKRNQKKKEDAEKAKSPKKAKPKPTIKAPPPEEENLKASKIQVKYKPFIENNTRQYSDHPFYHGSGIDFYIDGARFLPDNVTITKVIFNVLAQDGSLIVKTQYGLPELESSSYSPSFKLKVELRANYFSPTSIALISVETVDSSNGQVRTIGYSAINLFVGSRTLQLPVSDSESDIILQEGGYQIPIYCQEPSIAKPFALDKFNKLDKIPCASLLVRVLKAPVSPDTLMVLSKSSVPEKDWQSTGVVIPTPNYGTGKYNTEMCQATELERSLFALREERFDQPVKTKAIELMQMQGLQNPSDTEILRWIDTTLVKSNATELIDMTYFSKYLPQYGFKIAIDGFHNVPEKVPYVCLACLNPPGALHQTPIDPNQVYLSSKIDWESPLSTPHFTEDFYNFYNISAKNNLTLFLEVRTVTFNKKDVPAFKTVGWTVVPIFNPNGYMQSGCYQLPIFKGTIPKDVLDRITHNDAWPVLMELLAMKKSPVQLLEPMSVIVRVVDGQREGHFRRPFDYGRMIYRYLPQAKAHLYMYNSAVETKLTGVKKFSTILPKKVTAEEYNQKISKALKESLMPAQH